ncbi:methionine gamma-lyase [Methylobacterium terrae]|uniref:Methionine gamma-lyase n=1 Tax=Methylobacterium terrae TaxID=2202827 RepID=A0A2U8WHD0_9HYPH|nr:aminotransferase class I/II-fold pyridoxal phosphate-dependent enzyme [Methylobacterium terrae]AWN45533.1 methionine gamma-lyase [Methylobacterium terrae]
MSLPLASSTLLARIAVEEPVTSHPVAPPLFQTSTFWAETPGCFAAMATQARHPAFYTRYGNPTTRAFEDAVAALEGGEAALATASGMAAIMVAILDVVGRGDHVVAQEVLYGGTVGWLRNLAPYLGIDVTFVDQRDPDAFRSAIRSTTRLLVLETPSNPMMRLTDLRAVTAIARARGVVTLVDNTIASPINQQPLSLGADLVVHSATKYIGGHSDLSAGILVGSAERIKSASDKACLFGATLDPFAAWLALRGLRTLPLRVERHNATAITVARYLSVHPAVAAVHYPGLAQHPEHALARDQMSGFGGVLSFEVGGGLAGGEAVVAGLCHAHRSASFGSFSTLVVHPAAMWAGMMTSEQLAASGLPAGLVRLGVGLEEPSDIIADLQGALNGMPACR